MLAPGDLFCFVFFNLFLFYNQESDMDKRNAKLKAKTN